MKQFFTLIALASTLILIPGCASSRKLGEISDSTTTNSQEHHSMGHGETPLSGHSNSHQGHSMGDMTDEQHSSLAQAKLTISQSITPNTPVPLLIDINDAKGKAIANFDTFQEKLMHLIVVSDNLETFSHLHPTYKQNGRFEVEANFPKPGSYTLLSDYKPAGQSEQVSLLNVEVPGTRSSTPKIDLNRTKMFGDTKVNLAFSQPRLNAEQDVTLMFDLKEETSNQAITDLQPYLGEKGHLVILKQSSPLTAADYIHAHALNDTPAGQVHFMTSFPQPGTYKVWGQFNRKGKIITADFWVNVE